MFLFNQVVHVRDLDGMQCSSCLAKCLALTIVLTLSSVMRYDSRMRYFWCQNLCDLNALIRMPLLQRGYDGKLIRNHLYVHRCLPIQMHMNITLSYYVRLIDAPKKSGFTSIAVCIFYRTPMPSIASNTRLSIGRLLAFSKKYHRSHQRHRPYDGCPAG